MSCLAHQKISGLYIDQILYCWDLLLNNFPFFIFIVNPIYDELHLSAAQLGVSTLA